MPPPLKLLARPEGRVLATARCHCDSGFFVALNSPRAPPVAGPPRRANKPKGNYLGRFAICPSRGADKARPCASRLKPATKKHRFREVTFACSRDRFRNFKLERRRKRR